jgi:hypothetical protein
MINREKAISVLQEVLNGNLTRDDASKWAEKIYLNDDIDVPDEILWDVLGCIMGIDTPSTDREFLFDENDFQSWIDKLR